MFMQLIKRTNEHMHMKKIESLPKLHSSEQLVALLKINKQYNEDAFAVKSDLEFRNVENKRMNDSINIIILLL